MSSLQMGIHSIQGWRISYLFHNFRGYQGSSGKLRDAGHEVQSRLLVELKLTSVPCADATVKSKIKLNF